MSVNLSKKNLTFSAILCSSYVCDSLIQPPILSFLDHVDQLQTQNGSCKFTGKVFIRLRTSLDGNW